jgi:hypothetical protein
MISSRAKFTSAEVDGRVLYNEGKGLLDQADRLLAIVHAAREDASDSSDGIKAIIQKAEHLIDLIQNKYQSYAQVSGI